MSGASDSQLIDLTVVAPAHNEQDNVEQLVRQVGSALSPTGLRFEMVIVDDGSTDQTPARIREAMGASPWLRCIRMTRTPEGRGGGQSAAFHAGFRAARGALVASLDADLQNDPADIPAMLELMRERDADMVQGDRSRARRDGLVRRVGSRVGRLFRRMILGDSIRDTGCSLRVMRREIALRLPLELKGAHRFIPVTARQMGYDVVEMPVHHRPRAAGTTKYGMGILQRAIPGLVDCFGVRWMGKRRRPVDCEEIA
ncbi:MAG: glycosyltransferase family 2 protein [Phycisphaeraceae bacterium]|nr:glycosyltransferase family 2 protein [Phycisphaeraceae bacterium]